MFFCQEKSYCQAHALYISAPGVKSECEECVGRSLAGATYAFFLYPFPEFFLLERTLSFSLDAQNYKKVKQRETL